MTGTADANIADANIADASIADANTVDVCIADANTVNVCIVAAINDAHRRILECESSRHAFFSAIDTICGKPYAFECTCALANDGTAAIWFAGARSHAVWPLMRWLLRMYGEINAQYKRVAIDTACEHGHESVVRWLISLSWFDADGIDHAVAAASSSGMFRLAKYVLIRYDAQLREQNMLIFVKRRTFVHACAHRCVWCIRWLDRTYGLTLADVLSNDMDAFAAACANGHWYLARWMATKFGLTREHISHAYYEPLIQTCARGHLDIAQWLVEYFRLVARDVRMFPVFARACTKGHLGVARWLADRFCLTTRDARSRHNNALIGASREGHMAIAQWLVARFGLGRDGSRVRDNYFALPAYYMDIPVDTLKWLLTKFGPWSQQKDDWYVMIVQLAASGAHTNFARWIAKRFGVMPRSLWTALRHFRCRPDTTKREGERARRWIAAYAAE